MEKKTLKKIKIKKIKKINQNKKKKGTHLKLILNDKYISFELAGY